jgi:hypothetical protein
VSLVHDVASDAQNLTPNSLSVKPRRSCVRCSRKHPVAKDLAASTPALQTTLSTTIVREYKSASTYII